MHQINNNTVLGNLLPCKIVYYFPSIEIISNSLIIQSFLKKTHTQQQPDSYEYLAHTTLNLVFIECPFLAKGSSLASKQGHKYSQKLDRL